MMEELIKTAKIYYGSCSPAVRDAADKFFKVIDYDNDGKVSLHEFLDFMRREGHEKMSSRDFFKTLDRRGSFFKILDRRGSGTLGFDEVLALFYIIQSGRPFCHGCDVFVAGMYFTCSKCYQSDKNAIFLCPKCFENRSYTHPHDRNQFLDNYALLGLERKQGIARASNPSFSLVSRPSFFTHLVGKKKEEVQRTSSQVVASTSIATDAIVPYAPPHHDDWQKWKSAFEAMLLAVKAASLVTNCAANSCTIM